MLIYKTYFDEKAHHLNQLLQEVHNTPVTIIQNKSDAHGWETQYLLLPFADHEIVKGS